MSATGYSVVTKYDFCGGGIIPGSGSPDSGNWVKRITGAAPPTATKSGGAAVLALTADSQVQIVGIDHGDNLCFDIDDLERIEFFAKLSSAFGSNPDVQIVMGMASAYNATMNSVAANAWFHLNGSSSIVCETDDGTNDNDDIATGLTLGTAWKRFAIDFKTGIQTRDGAASKGGKGAVQFYCGDANQKLIQVCKTQLFDMSNYSSGLQPYFQILKASGTNTGTLQIRDVSITHRIPA